MSAPVPPRTCVDTKVYASTDVHGFTHVNVHVNLPSVRDAIQRGVSELGIGVVRDRYAEFEAEPAARRYKTLGEQVAAARAAIDAADAAARKVSAAENYLRENPEPDLANKLRQHAADLVTLSAVKAAAVADLEVIRNPAAKLYAEAATAVGSAVGSAVGIHQISLHDPEKAAYERLKAASESTERAISEAVARHLVPVLEELLAVQAAHRNLSAERQKLVDEMVLSIVGSPPSADVLRNGNIYTVKPPVTAPAPQHVEPVGDRDTMGADWGR